MYIKEQIINCNKTARSYQPEYIVVHDTGDPGATAQNEHDYFSGGDRGASADIFVDEQHAIQIIDTNAHYSWAVGDGHGAYGITNSNSLSIEMCLTSVGTLSEATIVNTIAVIKTMMARYGINYDHVVRHYDASRKCCPAALSANNWAGWVAFKARLSGGSAPAQYNTTGTSSNAVAALQAAMNAAAGIDLDVDGDLGPLTREAINKVFIHRGDKGPIVRWIQSRLGVSVDGDYGNPPYHGTYDAIINFQASHGLDQDGVVGPKTLSAML